MTERRVNLTISNPSLNPCPSVETQFHNTTDSSLVRSSTDTQAVLTDHTYNLAEREEDTSDSSADFCVDSVLRENTTRHIP